MKKRIVYVLIVLLTIMNIYCIYVAKKYKYNYLQSERNIYEQICGGLLEISINLDGDNNKISNELYATIKLTQCFKEKRDIARLEYILNKFYYKTLDNESLKKVSSRDEEIKKSLSLIREDLLKDYLIDDYDNINKLDELLDSI